MRRGPSGVFGNGKEQKSRNAKSRNDAALIARLYLETPFFGSRRMKAWLERRGMPVSRKRVQRLMCDMGLRAIYRRPGSSRRAPEHPVYPYLLRNVRITRPNQSLPSRRQGAASSPVGSSARSALLK